MSDTLSRDSSVVASGEKASEQVAEGQAGTQAGQKAGKQARKQVFIEKIFPVKLLNQQVYYEHGGNPFKGLHRWYSRKPLSFSRASVLGSILPADVSMEEFEYLLGLDKAQAGEKEAGKQKRWEKKLYKFPPTEARLKRVHDLCEETWGERQPSVLDAFAGGGSIPFEAVRYGLKTFASDLNPVAVVTMKAAMEYPLKFGPGLQEDIDKWVKWVGDEAEKRLAEFFPSQEGETVQNYLWAHTVVCPNCESVVPLSPNWWLYKRPEKINWSRWCAVKPIPHPLEKKVEFELISGEKSSGTTIKTSSLIYDPAEHITISRGNGKCLNCNSILESDYIDNCLLEKNFNHAMYGVAYKENEGKLAFRLPTSMDLEVAEKVERKLNSSQAIEMISREPFEEGEDTRCYKRGIRFWHELYNPRQLLTLITYVEIINQAKIEMQSMYIAGFIFMRYT